MEKRPLKIDEGRIKEFNNSDELPNQVDIEEVLELVRLLLSDLVEMGLEIKNEKLLNLL